MRKLFFRRKRLRHLYLVNNVDGKNYKSLIDYLYDKCNYFSFYIPNFSKTIETKLSAKLYSEYEIGYVGKSNNELEINYKKYKQNIERDIAGISKYIKKRYTDIEYCDSISGYEMEIVILEMNKETKDFLKRPTGLYEWLYPDFPEDVSFYINKSIYMRSVACDKICEFYVPSEELVDFLENNDFQFYVL